MRRNRRTLTPARRRNQLVQPIQPNLPVQAIQPIQPIQPNLPVQPIQPVLPVQPIQPMQLLPPNQAPIQSFQPIPYQAPSYQNGDNKVQIPPENKIVIPQAMANLSQPFNQMPPEQKNLPLAPIDQQITNLYQNIIQTYQQNVGNDFEVVFYTATDRRDGHRVGIKRVRKNEIRHNRFFDAPEAKNLDIVRKDCDPYLLCIEDKNTIPGKLNPINTFNHSYLITEDLTVGYFPLNQYIYQNFNNRGRYYGNIFRIINNLIFGLRQIHRHGMAHRDIKLDNILINPVTQNIKYIDFGISCRLAECREIPTYGARNYIPIEGFGTQEELANMTLSDYQIGDLWSLGLVILYLILGQIDGPHYIPPLNNEPVRNLISDYIEQSGILNNFINSQAYINSPDKIRTLFTEIWTNHPNLNSFLEEGNFWNDEMEHRQALGSERGKLLEKVATSLLQFKQGFRNDSFIFIEDSGPNDEASELIDRSEKFQI